MKSESESFDGFLKEKAQLLLDNLAQGDVGSAVRDLFDINDARNKNLYQQVGKITRGLHHAITNMELNTSESDDRDVRARVAYVISLTQEAANKTMDLADEATPIAAELGSESIQIRADWKKLASREMDASDFRTLYKRIDDFLAYSEEKSNLLHKNLTDIVVAQGYQDLSGQILYKIMAMLKTTEGDLVNLLAMSSQMEAFGGIDKDEPACTDKIVKDIKAEGPLPDVASTLKSQDEVDDLLSSLGF
jgi:chemotaxis protein CheZ